MKLIIAGTAFSFFLMGCCSVFYLAEDAFLGRRNTGYVIEKRSQDELDGPYELIERASATELLVVKGGCQYKITLRGCVATGLCFASAGTGQTPDIG